MTSARDEAANTDVGTLETIPSWIAARGYSAPGMTTRYLYPYEGLFTTGELGV
jgi:hypothetical protein